MLNIAVVLGTRPEAIKLAPLAERLSQEPWLKSTVIDTGQQPDLFRHTATAVGLRPDHTLCVHRPGQNLGELAAALNAELIRHFTAHRPDLVIVQGDTQSAAAAALAAAWMNIPVAHVEAGLRSGDLSAPFPEELNRRLMAQAAALHFAPTSQARDNLRREGIDDKSIIVTGNTVIDSLCAHLPPSSPTLRADRVLFTCHRRESWGTPLDQICDALRTIADRHPYLGWDVILPTSPMARQSVQDKLCNDPRFTLLHSVPYPAFVRMVHQARLVMTDSGGVTEEAATLGVPTVVLRNELDRPEALTLANVLLAGNSGNAIAATTAALLAHPYFRRDLRRGPFGDGKAAARIATALNRWRLKITPLLTEDEMFHPPGPRLIQPGPAMQSLAQHG